MSEESKNKKRVDELTIHIYLNSEGEYNYSIYKTPEDCESGENELDGGCCTTTMLNALGMANKQAEDIIKL